MTDKEPSSLPTRASLLGRLANWDDHQSWAEFQALYSPLIRRTARRAGLSETEAQDIEQETMVCVARTIREFDPAGGNFKAWLLNLVRWRIGDHFRRRPPGVPSRPGGGPAAKEGESSTGELVFEAGQIDRILEEEWQLNLVERALSRVSRGANPKHAQILDLCVIRGLSAKEVSGLLRVSVMTVYLVRTRLGKVLLREVERLRREEES